jgi:4-amino-4-deoxy-L-arabinose transferase-like glycosyltransferase
VIASGAFAKVAGTMSSGEEKAGPARSSRRLILALVVLAAILRVTWMLTSGGIIENEGGEYASIADNLLAGKGYVGQGLTGKPELLFPPLYPLTIAGLTAVARNSELAGRLVSMAMGLLLVVVMFKLADRIWGRAAAVIAGLLVAVHPILIGLSTSVYSEGTHFGLVFSALYLSVVAIETGRLPAYLAAGALYGLAYLTRPESVLYLPVVAAVALGAALINDRAALRGAAAGVAALGCVFLLVASPYVFFLWKSSGKVRFEGKSPSNFAVGQQMREGRDVLEAYYGVDDDLHETGAYMGDINRYIRSRESGPSPAELARYALAAARPQGASLVKAVRSRRFGGLPFLAIAVLGFAVAWRDRRRMPQVLLALGAGTILVTLVSVQFFWTRFAFIVVPFMALWAARGVVFLADKTEALLKRAARPPLPPRASAIALAAVVSTVAILPAVRAASQTDDLGNTRTSAQLTKAAGLWLRDQQPGDKLVMDTGSAIPYYARADYIALPYSSASTALRYIASKNPDFVILRGLLRDTRPYLADWLDRGLPGDGHPLVYNTGAAQHDEIKIYRWRER